MGKPLEITQDYDQNKNPQLMPDQLARAWGTVFYEPSITDLLRIQ